MRPRLRPDTPLSGTGSTDGAGTPRGLANPFLALVKAFRRIGGWRRAGILLLADALITTLSLYLAFVVRFEGQVPPERLGQFLRCLPLLLVLRLGLSLAFHLDRWSFRLSGLHEALRIAQATLLGSALFTGVFYFIQRAAEDVSLGPPRSVIVIEFLLTTLLVTAVRFSPRVAEAWGLNLFRPRVGDWVRTIIVGAGSAGELLLRDLLRSDEHNYSVIGFVDDQPSKRGSMIGGRQVLGSLDELPELCRRWRVEQILFAIPRLPPVRLRQVLDACADLRLSYKTVPVSFAYLKDRLSATSLQTLAPEDLLSRRPIRFEEEEIRPLVQGRRVLVTGAAGSIGSEIARQISVLEPAVLVLADINENNLYLLCHDLRRDHPELEIVSEIVDIRDAARLNQLGRAHQPQIILHAAAHKHVPLMEDAPEEAVKNNVVGCQHALDMAEVAGAERFVLISTDKAVEPTSVMGATKQLAELLVADRARPVGTRFIVVRFGNVLGSAGSVVPLFKHQIETGGPVTVTAPECRRYLMTLREAVGLTLLAGLGGDAGLFVLEMGEPIRILDLARLMITMTGHVPEREIPIVFTGLRPGEKAREWLMTPDEAATARRFRPGILAVEARKPGAELIERLPALEQAAREGDRGRLRQLLVEVTTGYVPVSSSVGDRTA